MPSIKYETYLYILTNYTAEYTGSVMHDMSRCVWKNRPSKHATADAKHVLKLDASNVQAQKLLRNVERRDIQRKRTDRKLAKDVCKWVNTATNAATSDGGAPVSGAGPNASEGGSQPAIISSGTHSFFYNNLLFQIVFVLIVSIGVKLWFQAYEMLKQ
jgi:hypothetical protein